MPVPTANLLMAVLSYIGGPLMAIPSPDDPAAGTSSSPEVTVSIADGVERVSAGQMVRYSVVVRNSGAVETPLTIKLTVPANAVTGLQAEDSAVVANAVAWRNVVGVGQTRTYSVAGRIDERRSGRDLAVTACVHEGLNALAVACATERNESPKGKADPTRRWAWAGSILFGILAVIGAVWLYRKVNPQPLTPDNALEEASMDAASSQPGGAPSA